MAEIKAFFVELSKTKGGGGIFDFLNLFTGGALKQFAIFGLGVMPYISASIIMQLLQVVIPHLERLAKEGDFGRKKINMYTRYLSIVLCVVQGLGILIYFKSQILTEAINMGKVIITTPGQTIGLMFTFNFILILTAGTMFLLWLGEQITERGLGNGISLLIFAGIVARIPTVIYQTFTVTDVTQEAGAIRIIILLLIFVAFIALVAFMQQGERRVTVKYAKRVVGNKMYQGQNTYIPFKVDPAGVIAIIFASSVILFPSQILASFGSGSRIMVDIARLLSPGSILYYILYLILVIFFCYFYTAIMYNPQEIAEHVRKNGGFIPGIRPGEQTSLFLQKLLNRLILPGAIIVGFIAIAPNIVSDILGVPDEVAQILGGTSLLIMVGVALDTLKQIESQLRTRNLDGFMKTNKTRSRHY
ncbi:MAG: preprotein translocase subunit SecY [Spirochaetae bacterium HGW-Spirochaetae-6]|nr:MAG: preprotein translocase subunit SecY [Spirochaetae bacterium HGW-Spirochaetae-6]